MQFCIKTVSGNTHVVDDQGQIDDLDGLAANVWDITGLRQRQTNRFIPIGELAATLPQLDLQPGGPAAASGWLRPICTATAACRGNGRTRSTASLSCRQAANK